VAAPAATDNGVHPTYQRSVAFEVWSPKREMELVGGGHEARGGRKRVGARLNSHGWDTEKPPSGWRGFSRRVVVTIKGPGPFSCAGRGGGRAGWNSLIAMIRS